MGVLFNPGFGGSGSDAKLEDGGCRSAAEVDEFGVCAGAGEKPARLRMVKATTSVRLYDLTHFRVGLGMDFRRAIIVK